MTSSTISTRRSLQRGADQHAALAVVLGFLAVVGIGLVVAGARQLHGQRGGQRDALVGRAEHQVEVGGMRQQALDIGLRQAVELGAVVEQPGVEEIGAEAPRLGFELAEAQHPGLHGEGDEVGGGAVGHGLDSRKRARKNAARAAALSGQENPPVRTAP
jgi:hypothetical protein